MTKRTSRPIRAPTKKSFSLRLTLWSSFTFGMSSFSAIAYSSLRSFWATGSVTISKSKTPACESETCVFSSVVLLK